jgi:transcriptional regulator with GAF, ATPase, and Fis domain
VPARFSRKKTQLRVKDDSVVTLSYFKYKLVVVEGAQSDQEFVVDKDHVRVGADASNDLVVDDHTVSRRHFEIRLTEEGYLIRDLQSTNGTEVEGCRVREAYLHPGARIGLGEVVMVFQPLREKVEIPLSTHRNFGKMIGHGVKMRALFHLAERVAVRDTTVLITGETGTGKGILADEIHKHSPRGRKTFVVVDCSTIPAELMESELFGHVKGAFTGASAHRVGSFAQADGGTILFDEIGELPASMQPKLLRVLETREIKPVGSAKSFKVDVRILAATLRDLRAEVALGSFREDLYFRLGVFDLSIPPLRERKEDVPLLARALLKGMAPQRRFGDDALRLLANHDWPGNVRELSNVIERVAHLVDDPVIDRMSLMVASASGMGPVSMAPETSGRGSLPFHVAKEEAEREYLIDLLKKHNLNISQAARTAGIHRQSLHRLLRKHAIHASEL